MKPSIIIKRAYSQPSENDGLRILVDRLWPRGLKKEDVKIDDWAKELAPTTDLRKWFKHAPALWIEFQHRYRQELEHNTAIAPFIEKYRNEKLITLVYAAKDPKLNHAIVLQQYLQQYLQQRL